MMRGVNDEVVRVFCRKIWKNNTVSHQRFGKNVYYTNTVSLDKHV